MGLFNSIGNAFKSVTNIVSSIGDIAKTLGGIMNSPLGGLLKVAFPPLAVTQGALNFAGMMGDLSDSIGGGQNYY